MGISQDTDPMHNILISLYSSVSLPNAFDTVGKLSAEEKREAKIKESMERRKEGGGGMVQDPAARGMKPCLNLNVGKQSRKVLILGI